MTREVSNLDIYKKVLEVKEDVILLREHVNDRSEKMEKHIHLLTTRLDTKADKSALLTSIGFRLLMKPFIRWGIGLLATSTLITVSWNHWTGYVARFLQSFV